MGNHWRNRGNFYINSRKQSLENDIESTPLHRSYGVKKRVSFFTYFNEILAVVLGVAFIGLYLTIFAMGIFALVSMLGNIGIMLSVLVVLFLVYFFLLRVVRKRLKFLLKLRRKCKSLGFKVKFLRGFFKGMRKNSEGFDFTVDTGKKCFCVRYFTTARFFTHIVFLDKDTIQIKRNITRSRLKYVLGLNNTKIKTVKYSFNDTMNVYHRKTQKILLLNFKINHFHFLIEVLWDG